MKFTIVSELDLKVLQHNHSLKMLQRGMLQRGGSKAIH